MYDFVIFVESTALPTLVAKNKKSAELWRALSDEQKVFIRRKQQPPILELLR